MSANHFGDDGMTGRGPVLVIGVVGLRAAGRRLAQGDGGCDEGDIAPAAGGGEGVDQKQLEV